MVDSLNTVRLVEIANLKKMERPRKNHQWTQWRADESDESKQSRRYCWANEKDDDDVDILETHRYGVVIFYNLLVDEKKCEPKSSQVCLRLGLDPHQCPIDLSNCKAIDSCTVGVSTASTVKNNVQWYFQIS